MPFPPNQGSRKGKSARLPTLPTLPELPGEDHLVPTGDIEPPARPARQHDEGVSPTGALRAYKSKESLRKAPSATRVPASPERPESYWVDQGTPPPIPAQYGARTTVAGRAAGSPPSKTATVSPLPAATPAIRPTTLSSHLDTEMAVAAGPSTSTPTRAAQAAEADEIVVTPTPQPASFVAMSPNSMFGGIQRQPTEADESTPRQRTSKRAALKSALRSLVRPSTTPGTAPPSTSSLPQLQQPPNPSTASAFHPPTLVYPSRPPSSHRVISGPSLDVVGAYRQPGWDVRAGGAFERAQPVSDPQIDHPGLDDVVGPASGRIAAEDWVREMERRGPGVGDGTGVG